MRAAVDIVAKAARWSAPRVRSIAAVTKVRPGTGDQAAAWIKKNMEDYYARPRRDTEYRSMAAWSLRQMDDKFSFLKPDTVVVDLGCFSGGWSQVAVERTYASSSSSKVIGIDKVKMDSLDYHCFIQGDVAEKETLTRLHSALGDRRADVVLSDLAPRSVGLKQEDHLGSAECCLWASNIMEKTLLVGGWFVVKMLYGNESERFKLYLHTRFQTVRTIRPPSSRSVYREMFYICRGFMGISAIAEEVQTWGSFSDKDVGIDRWSALIERPKDAPSGGPEESQLDAKDESE